jgi:hypothetical protein
MLRDDFSTISHVSVKQDGDVGGLQNQPQCLFKKKKIIIKPKVCPTPAPFVVASPNPEKQQTLQHSESKQKPKPKIIIKKSQFQREEENQDSPHRENITITKRRFKYSDVAPPATICFTPTNDLYRTPPPKCCRFFIDNRQCFLREQDNACISPISKKVIGFWNEKVGRECKLLPVENETMYEEIINQTSHEESSSSSNSASQDSPPPPSPPSQKQTYQKSPNSKNNFYITKSKFVSDAQRARIASEPVALLREKLAKQYGIVACHH